MDSTNIGKFLFGNWQSDRVATLREGFRSEVIEPKRYEKLSNIFGQMIIEYTDRKISVNFKGDMQCFEYKIIGCIANIVFIRYFETINWKAKMIVFIGNSKYWTPIGNKREYFRKLA